MGKPGFVRDSANGEDSEATAASADVDFDALWREGMRPDSPEARRARAEHPTTWDWIISRFRLAR